MLFTRSRRVPLATVATALAVLLVDWACHADRPTAPDAAAGSAGAAANRVSATARHDSVDFDFVCANRFRIRSRNDSALTVRWIVVDRPDSGVVTLPARPAGARFSETWLDVPDSGSVQLFEDGERIASAKNTGGVCDTPLLVVRVDPGVVASGAVRDSAYPVGSVVRYSFSAAPGYTRVMVLLDGRLAPSSGTVTMGSGHVLWAAADVDVALPSESDSWVVELRGLLTADDPVSRYQELLDHAGVLFDAVGPEEAGRRLRLAGLVAYDLIRDSAAIVRVDSALALHEFVLGRSEYGGSGGGGVTIANRAPGASREVAPGLGCAPQRPPEVAGTAEPTRVVYVNGIRTSFEEALTSSRQLDCELKKAGQVSSSAVEVDRFYNRSWAMQLSQAIRANVWCVAAGFRWSSIWSPLARLAAFGVCTGQAVATAVLVNDYVEALRQYAEVVSGSQSVEEDADSLARYVHGLRKQDGDHVVVVAHSQGNLMMQQAVTLLRARGLYNARRDSLCIGVVSIAAPTSSNWIIPGALLVGIQVSGDLLSLLTQRNRFPSVSTPYADSTAALIAEIQKEIAAAHTRADRQALTDMLAVLRFSNGVRLHSMDETYLGEQPARDAITGGVTYLHRQCTTGRLAIAPEDATLRVQSTLPIDVAAWNRNSTSMALNRGIAWSVPSHLLLSPNGRRVTALAPGQAELRASIFDRTAVAMIRVPMESLTVSATQVAHSAWKQMESTAPPGFPMPDPGAPPSWDGTPSTCTGSRTMAAFDPATGFTYTSNYVQHCWYSATGAVTPPDGIRIDRYWWRWYDVTGWLGDGPTNRLTTYSPRDMVADEPHAPFAGWGRLEVWGLNAEGVPIAKGSTCISHCGGT